MAQVTSHKNAPIPNLGTVFNALSLGVIHFVRSVISLVDILQQPIRNFHFKVFKANTPNQMDHTMWKSMTNCAQKRWQKLCAIMFAVTWAFGKMWCHLIPELKRTFQTAKQKIFVPVTIPGGHASSCPGGRRRFFSDTRHTLPQRLLPGEVWHRWSLCHLPLQQPQLQWWMLETLWDRWPPTFWTQKRGLRKS